MINWKVVLIFVLLLGVFVTLRNPSEEVDSPPPVREGDGGVVISEVGFEDFLDSVVRVGWRVWPSHPLIALGGIGVLLYLFVLPVLDVVRRKIWGF